MDNALFERDLLYTTQNSSEPGSVNVKVYSPNESGKLPIVIKIKTSHNPLDYIHAILETLQTDVFNRIKIDIKQVGIIYFLSINEQFQPLKVRFASDDKYSLEEVPSEVILPYLV